MKTRVFVVLVAALGAVVWLGVPELAPALVRERLWAFDHLRDWSRATRAAAAALVAALALVALRRNAPQPGAGALARLAARALARRRLVWAVAAPLLFAGFWALRQRNLALGDGVLLVQRLTRFVHLDGFHVTFDEALDLYLHSVAYAGLHRWLDWPVEDAYALLSSLAGVAWCAVMVALWRRLAPPGGILALGLILTASTASVQLFFGYVENYTLVALGLTVYVWLARRHQAREGGIFAPAFALGTSFSLHVLAGWLFPSLLYLAWSESPRSPRGRAATLARAGAGLLLAPAATLGYLAAIGFPPSQARHTHLAALKFVFRIPPDAPQYRFGAFSAEHLVAQANQLALVALPGLLPLAWVALCARRRPDTADRFLRFLAIATLFTQVFASTWNPELGPYADWDLFAVTGFFWSLLGAYAWSRTDDPGRWRAALPVAALCLSLTASWVASNATRRVEANAWHDDAHLRVGRRHAAAGEDAAAIRDFEEALRINPDNGEALVALAGVLWNRGERERALPLLRSYLERHPTGPHAGHVRRILGAP